MGEPAWDSNRGHTMKSPASIPAADLLPDSSTWQVCLRVTALGQWPCSLLRSWWLRQMLGEESKYLAMSRCNSGRTLDICTRLARHPNSDLTGTPQALLLLQAHSASGDLQATQQIRCSLGTGLRDKGALAAVAPPGPALSSVCGLYSQCVGPHYSFC